MGYEVLARKWRPQSFDDVVGQEHVTRTLRNAITSNRLAHAYLFVGPRGIGKTSIARIFAKCLNCEQGPTATPCGTCDACNEITAGNSLDVIEIDGASNNGVDQVRDLRDTVRFAPTRGPFKIYIIDEVHMLSVAAFNALLKTLEEPPAHVKFIFATTEAHKVLPTVISRCQRFDLRRIPMGQLVERLALIAESEHVTIAQDALVAVARGAEGGLRDAESSLDQLISFCGTSISEADVLAVFGLISHRQIESLVDAILAGNMPTILGIIAELDDAGRDLHRLLVDLMEYFRNLLIVLSVGDAGALQDVSDEQVRGIMRQAGQTTAGRVLSIIDVLTDAEDRMKYALSRRSLLETALIRCGRAATIVSLDEIIKHISALRDGLPLTSTPAPAPAPAVAQAAVKVTPAPAAQQADPSPLPAAPPDLGAAPARSSQEELETLLKSWSELIERVGRRSVIARGMLLDAAPLRVEGETVVIGVDPEFADEKEQLEAGRNRKALEFALSDALGRRVVPVIEVVKSGFVTPAQSLAQSEGLLKDEPVAGHVTPAEKGVKKKDEPVASVPPAAEDASVAPKKSNRKWSEEQAVKMTLSVLNGTIVEVRE